MNAYEIEQIEKDIKASFRLPLSYAGWEDVERRAREERARVLGQGFAQFFRAVWTGLARIGRQVRRTAEDCTDARLHHS